MMRITEEAVEWIKTGIRFKKADAAVRLYDRMEFQWGGMPVIQQPFEAKRRDHFADRGSILDYALTLGTSRILDFGPGDGWPSLLLAPMVQEVVGVDGSRRRVEVCAANAAKHGIGNASFIRVAPGSPLPFADGSFDGVAAASSIEQTPDTRATLRELCRVLKPGGRLRMNYENLSRYRMGAERQADLNPDAITVYDRHIDEEFVTHYQVTFDETLAEVRRIVTDLKERGDGAVVDLASLRALCGQAADAATWATIHPSCRSLLVWLVEAGFRMAEPTYNGGWFAGRLFDRLAESDRPVGIDAVDRMLRPLVGVVIEMKAQPAGKPGEWDPWITATK